MVATLPVPAACSVALVGTVVQERAGGIHAQFFSDLEGEWRQRVEQYLAERGNPESIPAWPAILPHRGRFVNLYDSPAEHSAQYAILQTLRERKLQYCPSCGEEGVPNTLDHYLPKQQFPQFAVTPANCGRRFQSQARAQIVVARDRVSGAAGSPMRSSRGGAEKGSSRSVGSTRAAEVRRGTASRRQSLATSDVARGRAALPLGGRRRKPRPYEQDRPGRSFPSAGENRCRAL